MRGFVLSFLSKSEDPLTLIFSMKLRAASGVEWYEAMHEMHQWALILISLSWTLPTIVTLYTT